MEAQGGVEAQTNMGAKGGVEEQADEGAQTNDKSCDRVQKREGTCQCTVLFYEELLDKQNDSYSIAVAKDISVTLLIRTEMEQ